MKNILLSALLAATHLLASAQTTNNLNLSEYGSGASSYGIAYGAPGVLGIPIRFYPNEKTALQIGTYLSGTPVYTAFDELEVKTGFAFAGSATFFGAKSYKSHKEKIKRHGFTLKAGHQFGEFSTSYIAGGWAVETFKKRNKNRSFIFELGLGGYVPHWDNTDAFYQDPEFTPTLMLNFHWNWYGKKSRISETPAPISGVEQFRDTATQHPRITFRTGLNISKLWEIGGSDELRSDEKTWWAKSMPVALAYEMPGNTPGHAFTLELSRVSKGFRDKTETTNNGSTTKSRTDLQMRFLQIAGLKTLPLGPQERKLRFHAQGGVFIAYATVARWKSRSVFKDDDTKRWTRQITKIKFGSEFGQLNANRFDAGLMAGAGVSYPVGYGRITFDARFSFGAMNLEKTKSEDPELKLPSLHTRDLALMVGYSVPISR